jgi:protein TonB
MLSLFVEAQDTTYYKNYEKSVKSEADSYVVLTKDAADTNKVTEKKYYISGKQKAYTYYTNYKEGIAEGTSTYWFENGNKKWETTRINGKTHGKFNTWWENGKVKREEVYENGEQKSAICFDENGNEVPFYSYEQMPVYPGGEQAMMQFIRDSIIYPKAARTDNIQGTVYVTFVVEKDGSLSDVRILRGAHPLLDAEALRVVKSMPVWSPGKQDGTPVRVQFNLPVKYTLVNKVRKKKKQNKEN